MSEDTSRRQSRVKQPKSYRVEDEYSFLDEDNDSAPSGKHTPNYDDDEPQEDGEDFIPDAEEEPEDDFDEEIVEDSSGSGEGDSDEDYPARGRLGSQDLEITEVRPKHGLTAGAGKSKEAQGLYHAAQNRVKRPIHLTRGGGTSAKAAGATPLRTRGVADFTKIGGQEVRLKDLYGPRNKDLKPILLTRDYWLKQETLPIRSPSSLRQSFFESPETRERELVTTRKWYANSGQEAFARGQTSRILTAAESEIYMANCAANSLNVLFGPINSPQLYTLKQGSYIHTAEPFAEKKNRRGWLFNLGSRIQDAQWASSETSTQYLAVAVEQKAPGPQPKPMENPKAPAFSATKPFTASIQIWGFGADENGWLDSSQQPRLRLVICTDWGAPKQFKWCPISPSDDLRPANELDKVHIGLLAGIWSDGRVRILDVSLPKSQTHTSDTHYLHISQAAFDVPFPQTIPSCLRWLSGTTLAVGTAIGTLAIWTLSRPETFTSMNSKPPRPWFYQQISETYIITLASGWPSQPHIISITTADGFARMFDLRTPSSDNTASIRGRTLCITHEWHEQTQSFIAPDEHYMLKHNPIRRYYHNLYTMRASSSITRVSSSPVQPAILMGGADGRVEASNPIGRITNYKIIPWQQTWFAHEWRGPVKDKPSSQDVEMSEGGPVGEVDTSEEQDTGTNDIPELFLSQPLARITEGYKAFQPGIQHSVFSKRVANPEVGKGITIFEEASAITALAWNPSLKFGTWAVAGMGDGLLRVEDIGV
ncbi:hypothetical protein CC86DRAFT_346958 [Ophiobolus disseminans]|uniref:WD40 repeat-like protein n=1 Tax=Ophiobolus disseminans TaxID=1469910 RepID=A0A6A7A741_9PLEO|nr:hypothetical protein CC86DRAFT_346958 [Ophiobolus disseminans]